MLIKVNGIIFLHSSRLLVSMIGAKCSVQVKKLIFEYYAS